MSIAFQHNSTSDHRTGSSIFLYRMACSPSTNSPAYVAAGAIHGEDRSAMTSRSSSTSSIGQNSDSDDSSPAGGREGEEVQSEFEVGSFDSLEALEMALPIKRGLSKFYPGKSKSFTSLADSTSCSSIKEITKPENALSRKRKNLLAHHISWDNGNSRNNSLGISKRPANCRSFLALSTVLSDSNRSLGESPSLSSLSAVLSRPPLPPRSRKSSSSLSSASCVSQNFSPSRSLSVSDLEGVAASSHSTSDLAWDDEETPGQFY